MMKWNLWFSIVTRHPYLLYFSPLSFLLTDLVYLTNY
jgi:hypothetical protein